MKNNVVNNNIANIQIQRLFFRWFNTSLKLFFFLTISRKDSQKQDFSSVKVTHHIGILHLLLEQVYMYHFQRKCSYTLISLFTLGKISIIPLILCSSFIHTTPDTLRIYLLFLINTDLSISENISMRNTTVFIISVNVS